MNVLTFKTIWKSVIDAFDVRDRRVGYVIGTGASTSMAPSATGSGSLGVTIAAGNYSKNGADASTGYAGGAITLTNANATNPRVDIVYMDSSGTLSKSDGTAAPIVAGTSGPVPVAWPAGCCPLAICFVPAGATDFTTGGYVLDARPFGVVPNTFTSPLTTKGDLFTWDTANQRLAVGSNGKFLTADSTQAVGLAWVALTAVGTLNDTTTSMSSGANLDKTASTTTARTVAWIHHKKAATTQPAMVMMVVGAIGAASAVSIGASVPGAAGTPFGGTRQLDASLDDGTTGAGAMAGTNIHIVDAGLSGTTLTVRFNNGDPGNQTVSTKMTWAAI